MILFVDLIVRDGLLGEAWKYLLQVVAHEGEMYLLHQEELYRGTYLIMEN